MFDETYVPFKKHIVDAVDIIVNTAHKLGCNSGLVETEADWKVVETIYNVWCRLFPEDYQDFRSSMEKIKSGLHNQHGSGEQGSAVVQHQLEMPQLFHTMFRVIFPLQKFDKKFVGKFVLHMPEFKVPYTSL